MEERSDSGAQGHAYAYLTQPEIRFLDAAVARLIPADELGPGAKEADVTYFIDRQLTSSWGTHGRNYRMGPWQEGTPQQGFQSRLTPQEIYRAAIRETDLYCSDAFGKVFAFLSTEQQDEVLHLLENDTVRLESVSAKLFFDLLLNNTEEGFFSDPMHGGNRDKIGWKMIGFPGVAASDYSDYIPKYNVPYEVEPVSILDIQQNKVPVDGQGYPKHVMLNRKDARDAD
jgi:gluconate 2-dehydrogenase gamma chain